MVKNDSGNGISWNYSSPLTVAQSGPSDAGCQDPTLWLDSSGDMHLGYLLETSPNTYSFKYLYSDTGDPSDFGAGEVAVSDVVGMAYPTIQCAEIPIGHAQTAIYSGTTEIYAVWRHPGTGVWSEPIQVDVNDIGTEPSMWIDQDNYYIHVVWQELDANNRYQVWYRRGQFVE